MRYKVCQYSLEGYKTRKVKQGETVYAVANHSGAFASKPDTHLIDLQIAGRPIYGASNIGRDCMVCVPYNQSCTIENLQVHGSLRNYAPNVQNKIGKRHVVTLTNGSNDRGNGDNFVFADGTQLASYNVTSPIYIGE